MTMASGHLSHPGVAANPSCGPATRDASTDAELIERFVRLRDEAAFSALVKRHGPMVLGVCRRVLHHQQDAEDAFQATFLVLARKVDSLEKPELLANWLYGVAYRTADHARGKAARRWQHEMKAAAMSPTKTESTAVSQEVRELLDAELYGLPEKYRMPLVLCYLEGKTNEEAARQLGWRAGSMSSRLARARELLRDRLTSRLPAIPGLLCPLLLVDQLQSIEVPPVLVTATVQAAVGLMGAKAIAAGSVAPAVHKWMGSWLRPTPHNRSWLTKGTVATLTALVLAAAAYAFGGPILQYAHVIEPAPQASSGASCHSAPTSAE
jgi:RNA polymerase sigma factor (sigma-70 family)